MYVGILENNIYTFIYIYIYVAVFWSLGGELSGYFCNLGLGCQFQPGFQRRPQLPHRHDDGIQANIQQRCINI